MNDIDYEGDKVLREIVDFVNDWLNSHGTEDYQATWEDERDESYIIVDERHEGIIALSMGNRDDGGNATVVVLLSYTIMENNEFEWEIESITYTFDGVIGIIKGDTGTKGA